MFDCKLHLSWNIGGSKPPVTSKLLGRVLGIARTPNPRVVGSIPTRSAGLFLFLINFDILNVISYNSSNLNEQRNVMDISLICIISFVFGWQADVISEKIFGSKKYTLVVCVVGAGLYVMVKSYLL